MLDRYGHEIIWEPKVSGNQALPMYQVLVEAIQDDINRGVLMRGFKMPPQRVLANQLGFNHGTVTRAYKICEEKGLLNGIVGKGTFVAASPGLPVDLMTDHLDSEIISMGMALPLYECNDPIENHIKQVMEGIDYHLALRYCPPEGHIKHRYVAANWMKGYKMDPKPENILITSGTQNALSIILMTLFQKGDRILVDEYTYTGLKSLAAYMNVILAPVPSDDNGMSVEALLAIGKREQARGIFLMPDHQNPTSVTLEDEKRQALAKVIEELGLLLIEDATYGFSLEEKKQPISALIPKQSFYILGTSKAISPTFRISYVVSPDQYVDKLRNGLNNIIWMASPLTSEIISLLQSTGRYEMIVEEKMNRLKERNLLIDEILGDYDVVPAPLSSFRLLNLPHGYLDTDIEHEALKRGVQVLSANRFYVGASPKRGVVRLAVSAPSSMETLEQGLRILRKLLDDYQVTGRNYEGVF